MRERISISIDPKTLRLIDQARGLVKRSNFVEEIIKEALREEGVA